MDPSLTMDWMFLLTDRLRESFGDRVVFVGLQGSRARDEADEDSDIDAVVILDSLSVEDLGTYRGILDSMPYGDLACGFVSGVDEIAHWDPADLFQFRMDTLPVIGDLDSILLPMDPEDSRRATVAGACSIYHACVHNCVHEHSPEILDSLFKQARFVLRAKHYSETGVFLRTLSDVLSNTEGPDREIAIGPEGDFDRRSEILIGWSSDIIRTFGNRFHRTRVESLFYISRNRFPILWEFSILRTWAHPTLL